MEQDGGAGGCGHDGTQIFEIGVNGQLVAGAPSTLRQSVEQAFKKAVWRERPGLKFANQQSFIREPGGDRGQEFAGLTGDNADNWTAQESACLNSAIAGGH